MYNLLCSDSRAKIRHLGTAIGISEREGGGGGGRGETGRQTDRRTDGRTDRHRHRRTDNRK